MEMRENGEGGISGGRYWFFNAYTLIYMSSIYTHLMPNYAPNTFYTKILLSVLTAVMKILHIWIFLCSTFTPFFASNSSFSTSIPFQNFFSSLSMRMKWNEGRKCNFLTIWAHFLPNNRSSTWNKFLLQNKK